MEKIEFKGSLSETLLINLYMRHLDSLQSEPILGDKYSSDVVKKIDYDFAKFDKSHMTRVGASIRARFIDDRILEFSKTHKKLVIVQIGAGFDTRPLRLRDKIEGATFYDIDLPPVMELRDKLIPSDSRMFGIYASMFDDGWIDELKVKHADSHFVFILEGVAMYFEPSVMRDFFKKLAQNFCGIIACDIMSENAKRIFKKEKHDSLKYINGDFVVYGSRADELCSERVRLVSAQNMMDMHKSRWSLKARLFMLIPAIRNISKLCVYEIGMA